MLPQSMFEQAEKVIRLYEEKKLTLATVESCTGGLVAATLTAISGSSHVLERGYVTYSNNAKKQDVNVPESLLAAHGAVSEEVALAMASGALNKTGVNIALAITGIAGPTGGSAEKPVGLVYIAIATATHKEARRFTFHGDRTEIRRCAVVKALSWFLAAGKELL